MAKSKPAATENLPATTSSAPVPAAASDFRFPLMTMAPTEISELIKANIGNSGLGAFDLPRIKVPGGGGLAWAVLDLDGNEEPKKFIDGIIVLWKDMRAYWKEEFGSGEIQPPDCKSDDAVRGQGEPGGLCANCPMAEFGSDPKGVSQACKEKRLIFMLTEGSLLPTAIFAPTMSVKPLRQYFLRLVNAQRPYYSVITRLALERDKSSGGIDYSKIVPTRVRDLSGEEVERVKAMTAILAGDLAKFNPTPADMGATGGSGPGGEVG